MKWVTKRDLITNIVAAWECQFGPNPEKPSWRTVLEQLRTLDLHGAAEDDLAAIIGNRSWTRLECVECQQDCETAFQLGNEFDPTSQTAYLCPACMENAHAELSWERPRLLKLAC